MFNPFSEIADDSSDAALVEQAKNGGRASLEQLVLRHKACIYNIAVRMVFDPHDAEEVTQEVLVKGITKLSTFKGQSKFRTWLYRIAANHVLNMMRRSPETKVTKFADCGGAIDSTPHAHLHPTDGRATTVALTESGQRKFRQVFKAGQAIRDQMVSSSSAAETRSLVRLLRRVSKSLADPTMVVAGESTANGN